MSHLRAILSAASVATFATGALSCAGGPRLAEANDNRRPAGVVRGAVREVRLEAQVAKWLPDDGVDSSMTIHAFASRRGVPMVPGPLLRVSEGDSVRLTVVNTLEDSSLVLHGIQGFQADSIRLAPGTKQTVTFVAGTPGTFTYWASTTGKSFGERSGIDSQLTGAFVVDPAGTVPDTSERIFVITMLDVLPDTTKPPGTTNDLFDVAINGKSWPFTEEVSYVVGDTVRWRWVNGGYIAHPMHLHGFHFRRTAKGNGSTEAMEAEPPHGVTELMRPRSTFRMEFVPTRAGNWLFHCHMLGHITPFPERPDSVRHLSHDPAEHARTSMSGLVMGVKVRAPGGEPSSEMSIPSTTLRLLAQEAKRDSNPKLKPARGFVLQRGTEPRADSIEIPGTPLILTRGERVGITVVNRIPQHTSVHWHGMELESYFDGVAGYSGADARRSPFVAPGDSFTVVFTPPRAGTFMYHTHMEEEPQLQYGMFGAMIVLEPGERYDPRTDRTFILGSALGDGSFMPVLNGGRSWDAPMEFRVGTTYRMRLVNIQAIIPVIMALQENDSTFVTWLAHAKDGADLPESMRVTQSSVTTIGVGETYDFLWTPRRAQDLVIRVRSAGPEPGELRMPVRVR
jgi:FtsP/CotA-like multicopper oxidase with cupredoxin domain